LNASSGLLPL